MRHVALRRRQSVLVWCSLRNFPTIACLIGSGIQYSHCINSCSGLNAVRHHRVVTFFQIYILCVSVQTRFWLKKIMNWTSNDIKKQTFVLLMYLSKYDFLQIIRLPCVTASYIQGAGDAGYAAMVEQCEDKFSTSTADIVQKKTQKRVPDDGLRGERATPRVSRPDAAWTSPDLSFAQTGKLLRHYSSLFVSIVGRSTHAEHPLTLVFGRFSFSCLFLKLENNTYQRSAFVYKCSIFYPQSCRHGYIFWCQDSHSLAFSHLCCGTVRWLIIGWFIKRAQTSKHNKNMIVWSKHRPQVRVCDYVEQHCFCSDAWF